MTFQSLARSGRSFAAAIVPLLLVSGLSSLPSSDHARAGSPGTHISADYKISLNGFNVGTFHYTSQIENNVYTLNSDVELSLLLGTIHWKGVSRTVGSVNGAALNPGGFDFQFDSTLKSGSLRMGFDRGNVKSVAVDPPAADTDGIVPVQEKHLKGVLDPLSAVMALTRGASANPCARKVAIFDGKQRFDLQLAFRRHEPLGDGQSGTGTVCAVRYTPIAGYKSNGETANLAGSTGIEITFQPVPGADLQVPHRVVLPTLAGQAELTAERVDVKSPGQGLLALVN